MEQNNKPYRLISVSGSSGTGKSLFTLKLSDALGWNIFSLSQKLRDEVKKNNLDVVEVNRLPEETHRQMDALMIATIKNEKNQILESRLAGWQSRGYRDILKILLVCSDEVKNERYAKREELSLEEAEKEIANRNESNLKQYIKLYQAGDYLNPKYYDLIIDSSHLSINQEVELALNKFNRGFKDENS